MLISKWKKNESYCRGLNMSKMVYFKLHSSHPVGTTDDRKKCSEMQNSYTNSILNLEASCNT